MSNHQMNINMYIERIDCMKVLISYFEPFNQETINSSKELMMNLKEIEGIEIDMIQLPVVRHECMTTLLNEMRKKPYDYVISLGQATGRKKISLERVAINVDDFRIKDNAGNQICDQSIFDNGQNAYFSTLPIRQIMNKVDNEYVEISNTAGTFVCNHLFYGILYFNDLTKANTKYGFIHVPALPSQVKNNEACMELETSTNVFRQILEVLKDEIRH